MRTKGYKIAVLGSGANGASIGAELFNAGHDVTFIEQWPDHVEHIRKHGLIVDGPDGRSHVQGIPVFHLAQVAELRTTFDLVLIGLKAYDTRWGCELIKPVIHDETQVVGLQNGITTEEISEILGAHRTIGAVLGVAANLPVPGLVNRDISVKDTWIAVGALTAENPHLPKVAEVLRAAAKVDIDDDIVAAKWMKLIVNSAEVMPSSIVGLPLVEASQHPEIHEVMINAGIEAYQVSKKLGIKGRPILGLEAKDFEDSENYVRTLLTTILSTYSSPTTRVAVLQDWEKGRHGEIEAFSGYICTKGKELHHPTPYNCALTKISFMIEQGDITPHVDNISLLRKLL